MTEQRHGIGAAAVVVDNLRVLQKKKKKKQERKKEKKKLKIDDALLFLHTRRIRALITTFTSNE